MWLQSQQIMLIYTDIYWYLSHRYTTDKQALQTIAPAHSFSTTSPAVNRFILEPFSTK